MRHYKAKLSMKPDVRPAVENEIDRLEAAGLLESVSDFEWASPLVPKPDGRLQEHYQSGYRR